MELIIHPSLGNYYLMREIDTRWWEMVEMSKKGIANVGDTFLVRRNVNCYQKTTRCLLDCEDCSGPKIVSEYGTTFTEDGWKRQKVVFPLDKESPYPFQIDCFSNRLSLPFQNK